MKPELILQADLLDIIFDDRNKEYGAYSLRKGYHLRMIKAMTGAFLLSIAFSVINFLHFSTDETTAAIIIIPENELQAVNLEPEKPLKPQAPRIKSRSIKFTTPLIIKDEVADPIPEINEIVQDVLIGTQTFEGPPSIGIEPTTETTGSGSEILVEKEEKKDKVLYHAEVMPEFPGGQAAFMRFLSRHLRVPDEAVEPGQKIKILVQFVVGKDGQISNIQFIQTNGEVFEHEVLRVMKKMPTWRPGMQNGEAVAVYFKLPVIFETQGE